MNPMRVYFELGDRFWVSLPWWMAAIVGLLWIAGLCVFAVSIAIYEIVLAIVRGVRWLANAGAWPWRERRSRSTSDDDWSPSEGGEPPRHIRSRRTYYL